MERAATRERPATCVRRLPATHEEHVAGAMGKHRRDGEDTLTHPRHRTPRPRADVDRCSRYRARLVADKEAAMAFLSLVRPLDGSSREVLDAVAKQHGLITSADTKALGEAVRKLSDVYNRRAAGGPLPSREARAHLGARLAFSFPRDVPKGAGAVRELVGTGFFEGRERLRVLDVGAGLGAMTHGLRGALEAAGWRGVLAATLVDADPRVLTIARDLAAAPSERGVTIDARTAPHEAPKPVPTGPYDLIFVGQVLSELDENAAPEARVEAHASWLTGVFEALAPDGALVIVEPALRDRTRHLQLLRDALANEGIVPFAPCLHAAPCPMLTREDDWCHEDLAVDLPAWLVPVARAAGLRHEGLSFSYLVLRKDKKSLRDVLPAARVRVVSDLMRSKGKLEAHVCGALAGAPDRIKLRRLDRHLTEANAAWDRIRRGDLVALPPLEGERLEADIQVDLVEARS